MRLLTPFEIDLITRLGELMPTQERNALQRDLAIATVEAEEDDPRVLTFALTGLERRAYKGQSPYSVEASLQDEDGAQLHLILFKDRADRLFEMQLIRWDDGSVISPDLASMKKITFMGDIVPFREPG